MLSQSCKKYPAATIWPSTCILLVSNLLTYCRYTCVTGQLSTKIAILNLLVLGGLMWNFWKTCFLRLVTSITGLQAFSWLFGFFDEVSAFVRVHTLPVVSVVIIYLFIEYVAYDSTKRLKRSYTNRLKGASIRNLHKDALRIRPPTLRRSDKK